ncbi:cation:proton antiporter [Nocardia sp. NPDC051570]|uniref:cation:proton antiporter n=1 Tax=Nocardia sp. NPDC051570 TaxID=3364324 RepID=UPI003796E118
MQDIDLFRMFAGLGLLLVSAHLVGRLFSRLRQPVVIGEIVGGLLLGPTVLGAAAPGVTGWLFPPGGPAGAATGVVYQFGLLLLMFLAGTQMRTMLDVRELRPVVVISVTGIVIPFLLGLGFAWVTNPASIIGRADSQPALTLVIAIAIAVTSIPVISRIMLDLGILQTSFARIVLAVAVLEDVVLNVVIAIALGLAQHGKPVVFGLQALLGIDGQAGAIAYHAVTPVLFFVLAFLCTRWLRGPSGRPLVQGMAQGMALLLGMSALCVFLGVVPIFGAFVVGLSSAPTEDGTERPPVAAIRKFATAFFIPIYFAVIGLKLDLVHHLDALFTLCFIGFACVIKAASVYMGARIAGSPPPRSAALAAALNARGGPGIVLAGIALDAGIVNATFFTTLLLTAVVTSLLAGSWLEAAVTRSVLPRDETTVPVPARGKDS